MLQAYRKIKNDRLELCEGIIYNQELIYQHIAQFLYQYNVRSVTISSWICGPAVVEQLIKTHTAHPSIDSLNIDKNVHVIDYTYLYPLSNATFVFYVTYIAKAVLFQYQLLGMRIGSSLQTMTTYSHALIHLYKWIQGTCFRHSNLTDLLLNNGNNIITLFNKETINRTMSIHQGVPIDVTHEYIWLLGMAGLYHMESDR